ncbi:hypothetical protein ABFX02_10G174900 [Erythranthe guttata]
MRIRRRLPPCSSIPTAAPLSSDLHLQPSLAAPPSDLQPSDESMPIPSRNNRWVFPQTEDEKMNQKKFGDDETYWSVEAKKISNNNDIRKIVNMCVGEESCNKLVQPSSSSAQGDYEVVPLKKRRGGFDRNIADEDKVMIGAEMKSKTNKKCVDKKPVVVAHEGIIGINNYGEKMKSCKIVRGSVIMEGSRCSRVNGRGWRCCHPTLVGYSLCQHHLAKGRLRSSSISSSTGVVRRRGKVVALHGGAEPLELSGGDLAVAAVQQQPLVVVTKKRTKVGVVKARSMSSLLSQI